MKWLVQNYITEFLIFVRFLRNIIIYPHNWRFFFSFVHSFLSAFLLIYFNVTLPELLDLLYVFFNFRCAKSSAFKCLVFKLLSISLLFFLYHRSVLIENSDFLFSFFLLLWIFSEALLFVFNGGCQLYVKYFFLFEV